MLRAMGEVLALPIRQTRTTGALPKDRNGVRDQAGIPKLSPVRFREIEMKPAVPL